MFFLLLELVPLLPQPLFRKTRERGGEWERTRPGTQAARRPEDRRSSTSRQAEIVIQPTWIWLKNLPNHLSCYCIALPLCPEGRDSPTVSTTCWWYQPVWRKETLKENFKSIVFEIEWPLQLRKGGGGSEEMAQRCCTRQRETEMEKCIEVTCQSTISEDARGRQREPLRRETTRSGSNQLDPKDPKCHVPDRICHHSTPNRTTLIHQPTQRGWCIDAFSEEKSLMTRLINKFIVN